MAEEIIKARVWTKVDTLENWNNNPLLLGPGEMALVTTPSGIPLNMKWGDKSERKRFSDLPFAISYDQGQFVAIDAPGVLPTPESDVAYSLVGPGTYTFAGQSDIVAPEGRLSQLLWDGSSWSLVDMGELPVQPADGIVALNDTGATSGDTVYKALAPLSAIIEGGNFPIGDTDFSSYTTNNTQEYIFIQRMHPVLQDGVVDVVRANLHRGGDINLFVVRPTGVAQQFQMVHKILIEGATVGDNIFNVNFTVLKDDQIAIGQLPGGGLITTKTQANGLWLATNPDYNIGQSVTMSNSNRSIALSYELNIQGFDDKINQVDAKVDDLQVEVSGAMKEYDLTIEPSINMFNPEKIVSGKYVSNSGSVASNASFACILINVENIADGEDITINGFNTASVATPAYWAFYTTDNPATFGLPNLIEGSNAMFTSNPQTFQKPAGAVGLAINILRTNQTASVYANATINLGTTPISYQPFTGDTITKYKDYNFAGGGGGESYDQSLNTTDNVEFNSVITHALLAELPEGAGSPPAGVLIGQAWIDTTDDSIKVRRV